MAGELGSVQGLRIDEVDLRSLSEEDLQALNAFTNILRAEARPEDPPWPLELTRAEVRAIPPFVRVWAFCARQGDGSLAGRAVASAEEAEENRHLLQVDVSVRPDHRRRGVARALLGLVAEVAEASGRTLLMGYTSDRVPAGEAFARRVGAEPGQAQHVNRLLLCELDRELVARWVREGTVRGAGYSLVWVDGPYPEDLVEEVLPVYELMNTAPRDGLQVEDARVTVERVRGWEQTMAARGDRRWSVFVRKDATDELVGFTEVTWNPALPKVVQQLGTAVRPADRGRGLGKWIKAAMLQRILAERPEAEEVRTANADSNEAMLAINRRLGFKPFIATTVWQASLDRVRAYLAGAGGR